MKISLSMLGALGARVRLSPSPRPGDPRRLIFDGEEGQIRIEVDRSFLELLREAVAAPPAPPLWTGLVSIPEQHRRDWNQVAEVMQRHVDAGERLGRLRELGLADRVIGIRGLRFDWFALARSEFVASSAPPAVFLLAWFMWLQQRGETHFFDQDRPYFRAVVRRQAAYTQHYLADPRVSAYGQFNDDLHNPSSPADGTFAGPFLSSDERDALSAMEYDRTQSDDYEDDTRG